MNVGKKYSRKIKRRKNEGIEEKIRLSHRNKIKSKYENAKAIQSHEEIVEQKTSKVFVFPIKFYLFRIWILFFVAL